MNQKNQKNAPRIALISAVPTAIEPARAALEHDIDGVDVWNILDDRLLADASAANGVTPQLHDRMTRLINHARTEGADAVLLTCSLYGGVARSYTSDIPVLAPDDSAIADAARGQFGSIAVVASIPAAMEDSVSRVRDAVSTPGQGADPDPGSTDGTAVWGVVPDALHELISQKRFADAAQLTANALTQRQEAYDAVFLAQYSLSPLRTSLAGLLSVPIISGPSSAARHLREVLATP